MSTTATTPTTSATPTSPVLRASLVATGVLLALVGAYAFVAAVPPGQWVRVALWTAGGVAAHDVVIAPVAIALGWFLARNAPARRRRVMRTSLLAVTTVVLILVTLLATGGCASDPAHGRASTIRDGQRVSRRGAVPRTPCRRRASPRWRRSRRGQRAG
ncbi:hypothetical protein [Lapillicoccus sp.]|uniref:hypothetical protein n=1 Tax=Lapillicoccus sp. TaxID=1909287 RepID=UPI003983A5B2